MTIEIIKLYVSCISQFFTLSDVAIASSPNNPTANEPPEFLPQHSNSITTCHFASRVLAEIVETSSELEGIGGTLEGERAGSQMEVRTVLKGFVESCRWRFEEAICTTWSKGEFVNRPPCIHVGRLI
jgi:exocyst complex component 2